MFPKLRKPLLVLFNTLLLFLIGWGGPMTLPATSVAHAKGVEYWARWKVELDFANDQINANWIVMIGNFDADGTMQITAKHAEWITCTPYGNFTIKNGEAIFDGTSYLECAIPSYYATVAKLFGGQPLPFSPEFSSYCSCVNPVPWVAADLTLTSPVGMNPLVYQVDRAMAFKLERTGDVAISHLLLNDSKPVAQALQWLVASDGNQLWSGSGTPIFQVITDPGSYSYLPKTFYEAIEGLPVEDYVHWANTVAQPLVFTDATEFKMTSQPTTFLVGYDTKHFFVGKVRKLSWDPSCDPPSGL